MQFDVNIFVLLMLNVGIMLAFAFYGSRLFNRFGLATASQKGVRNRVSGLGAAFRVPRPVRKHHIPRIKAKSDSADEEPPHMPF